MTNQPVVSNSKIIILIAFVCCALMTSLFVYHLRNKQELSILANGDATVFPVAREIKPFKLITATDTPFSESSFRGHWTLLFFGFTHCSTICPATLNMIAHAHASLAADTPDLQVVLITLDPERDAREKLQKYLAAFNPTFIGVTGKIQDIRKLQAEFGIFSARENTGGTNYQLQHTPSVLLINPEGKWAGIIKSGMQPDLFAQTVNQMTRRHA